MNLEGLNPISERLRSKIFSTGPLRHGKKILTNGAVKMTIWVPNDIMMLHYSFHRRDFIGERKLEGMTPEILNCKTF
jgi:hypothetical protein